MVLVDKEKPRRTHMGTNGSLEANNSGLVSQYREPLFSGGVVTPFTGKTNLYTVETYRSGSEIGFVRRVENHVYQEIPEHAGLVVVIRDLYRGVYPQRYRRDPELTLERISKGLSYPRTILELVRYQGLPIGYGIFPRLLIGRDEEPVLYSSRAFVAEHEGQGVGTHVLERAIRLHRVESARAHKPLRYGMLITQNPYSLASLEKLIPRGVIVRMRPFGEPHLRDILYGAHSQVFISSAAIEATGVSRGELSEVGYNETVTPPQEGTRAMYYFEKMTKRPPDGVDLHFHGGDVLYVGMDFPEIITPALAA